MMLCKLSLKNIQKSIKDYAIYFFTLILGVAIFYVFNSLDSQTVMMEVSSSTKDIIKLMTNMLSGVSVFISFILGFLIIYASRFLIKRRNKEFGIYLTLGMSKRKISLILFLETIIIGLISLVVGLGLGIILSQFMSIIVANMFEANLREFTFVFSSSACFKTLLYFSIMYLIVMIFNTISISRCKLIDLLSSSKKSEKIRLKNPYLCSIIFIIFACILSYAYYLVTAGIDNLNTTDQIFIPIILGSVSTFFIIWSISGLILTILKKCPKLYYKGLNSFILRQISSKINTTVFSMTIICLMLFITICVLSSSLSIKNSMTYNLTTLAPVDIEFYKPLDLNENNNESTMTAKETLIKLGFNVDEYFKDMVEINLYAPNDILIKDTLGISYPKILEKYPYLNYNTTEKFIKLSDYNKIAKVYGLDSQSLKDNEYILIADFNSWIGIRNEGLKENTSIELLGKTYYPKYQECQNGFIHISSSHINMGIFIVPDNALDEKIQAENILIANYKVIKEEEKIQIEQKIKELENHPNINDTKLSTSSKISIYENSVGLGALVTFIGLYLGIIFLISSAVILALKELSDSTDNKKRFQILRKIGADESLINKALFRQIAIFFMFPLILAIIHSIFGIMFCDYILETFGDEKLLASIIMTSIFIILIYGGYFIITYYCSKNIIKER